VTGDEKVDPGLGVVKNELNEVFVDGHPAGTQVLIPGHAIKNESDGASVVSDRERRIKYLADTDGSDSETDPGTPEPKKQCIVHGYQTETWEQTLHAIERAHERADAEGTERRPTPYDPGVGPINIPRSRAVGGYHVVDREREYEVARVFDFFPNHSMGRVYMVAWVGWPYNHYTIEPCSALAGCCSCEPSRL
jgi:hypothetical protein